ncbi:D-alanine--D-alanine ligase [candidate division GN15 bacterium]|nr:D-alanine--D-alanine ligase [candidate division GN15 bacterium]
MKVLLLAGGNSSERQVSLDSSAAIARALEQLGHQVDILDPASGERLQSDGKKLLPISGDPSAAVDITSAPVASPAFRQEIMAGRPEWEVVFLGLHGGAGENGTIQNLLELAGLAYTGSNMTASAVAMDKAITKRVMQSLDMPTPAFAVYRIHAESYYERAAQEIAERFDLPVIVKPNDSGSTVGLTRVSEQSQMVEALRRCARESSNVLVEEYVAGREMTVAVLNGQALPVVEIRPKSGLYDYEAKYTKGKTEYVTPAPIDDAVAQQMQSAAVSLYDAIGAEGLARVDFILDDHDTAHCLELNTLPGMTELSLSPMAARAAGISFEQLVDRIVTSAMERHARQ